MNLVPAPIGQTGGMQCPTCARSKYPGALPNNMNGSWQACPTCAGTTQVQPDPIRVPYDWTFANAVLTALQAGVPVTTQFDQDADFEWLDWITNSTGTFSFQVTDASTGRVLSNLAVNGENGTGTAQLPRRLIEPYTIARSSSIKITFNDRSNAGNTIQFVASGYKLYPRANPAQGSQGVITGA